MGPPHGQEKIDGVEVQFGSGAWIRSNICIIVGPVVMFGCGGWHFLPEDFHVSLSK